MQQKQTRIKTAPKHLVNLKTEKKGSFFKDIKRNPLSYLLIFPAVLYTFIFGYLTIPYLIIAFQKFNYRTGIFNSAWVGFKNFEFFFKSASAFTVTWNTIRLNCLFILFLTVFSVAFAILLNEIKNKWFVKFTQSTFLFPYFISWVIASYIIYTLFSLNYGVINKILSFFSIKPVSWYMSPKPWTWILVGMRIWHGTGMSVVIYLAAITGISNELYEAAIIDGANRWQKIKSITIPLMMPTVAILTLLSIGRIMYGDFGMFWAIIGDNGILYPTTDVIDTYVFRALRLLGDPAQAMAVGLFQAAVGFILVYTTNHIVKKTFSEGALF
jgi:putative aldouronate transport system permease protein